MSFYVSGAGRSSEVERLLMVRWVVGSILHGVDPLSYFSFQPVLHDWCNKGRGMCYPVCGMVHIKEPLLLIDKNSLCGSSGFPFSLSEWSLTICLTPYNRRYNVLSASLNKTFLSLSFMLVTGCCHRNRLQLLDFTILSFDLQRFAQWLTFVFTSFYACERPTIHCKSSAWLFLGDAFVLRHSVYVLKFS